MSGFQERSEFCRGLELRYRVQFLEGRGEGVRQAPHGARHKVLELRVEVEVVDFARQVLRGVQLFFDERSIYKKLGVGFRELKVLPALNLAAPWARNCAASGPRPQRGHPPG